MMKSSTSSIPIRTMADLLARLGHIPLERIRFQPAPGTATEQDILDVERREDRLCEMVDGVLVEKAMGYRESLIACALIAALEEFVTSRNLGLVSGPDGFLRLFTGLVRIPDVAFASWDRLPGRRVPEAPIPEIAPDLAVEVLSESNTGEEMERKRGEYFASGVRLVWIIDPNARTVAAYTSPEERRVLDESQVLDGGQVLPGFAVPLRRIFAKLDSKGA